ncbi:MAG: hypothetical protein COB02_00100 [Candidatus Cloacimonadota bacterium]|nr:MAG: hypothetical protein COB02_04235 [Candidatus Cloacimonadota bacterium]PCJ21024.1 MAG: hypothetical protein COB02_00100 [Candidatus Cloacimonadota bacterium]
MKLKCFANKLKSFLFLFIISFNFCVNQELNLAKGFQLFPCLLTSVNLSLQNFGEEIIVLWTFDSNQNKYLFFTNDQTTKQKLLVLNFEAFETLNSNKSYFIFSPKAITLILSGSSFSSPSKEVQFTKSQETLFTYSSSSFKIEDLGLSYDSIWLMRNQNWLMYSPDINTTNKFQNVPKIKHILANEPFIIISKNASLVQFPNYDFPKHYGIKQGFILNAIEIYGYDFQIPRNLHPTSASKSLITSTQDYFIEWLHKKQLKHLLINPISQLKSHYLSSSHLNEIGLNSPIDDYSFCQFLTKLKENNIHTGVNFKNLLQLNTNNQLSTSSLVSILKLFETTGCLSDYLYSPSIDSSLLTTLQSQMNLKVFSQNNLNNSIKKISSLSDTLAFYQNDDFPIILLDNQSLQTSAKNALYYSRYKENSNFLYSIDSSLSLTKDFTNIHQFNFSSLLKYNKKYKIETNDKIINIVLLGFNSSINITQQSNLSDIIKVFHSLGYKTIITNQQYQEANIYYILHNSSSDISSISSLLNNDKVKFWQNISNPLMIPNEILNHFQINLGEIIIKNSQSSLSYKSQSFQFSKQGSSSILFKSQDMSQAVSHNLSLNNDNSYIFHLNNIFYINTNNIDQQIIYIIRNLLNEDGIIQATSSHYSTANPALIYSKSDSNIQLQINNQLQNVEETRDFQSITYSALNNQQIQQVNESIYFLSQNHSPIASLQASYLFSGGENISISSTNSDLDLDSLTYQWSQILGNNLTINDDKSSTLRLTLPQKNQSIQTFKLNFQSFDGKSYSNISTTQITIPANNTPVITFDQNLSFKGATAISINPEVFDANSDNLIYLWEQISGIQVLNQTINTQSLDFNTPVKTNQDQTLSFKLSVSDSFITTSKNIEIIVEKNKVPEVFVDSNIQVSLSGLPFTFNASSRDLDQDSLTYTWRIISPTNIEIQVNNGFHQQQLSIISPTTESTLSVIVGVKVSDGFIDSPEKNITLQVEVCNLIGLCK